MEPLIRSVAERIKDDKPPGWLTVWRDYRKWVGCGPRHSGNHFEARRSGQERVRDWRPT